ncbi:MAG: glycosyltransferase family 9 protein [Deltaproteobacteria bacterium]|nr:glycosyltransferase family 9 protein [Deltaproteobacteria bacterium]
MRLAICREGGGLGDVLRCAAVARKLQKAGWQVDAFTLSYYAPFAEMVAGVDKAWPIPTSIRWNNRYERKANWEEGVREREYFARGGRRDKYVNMFCPGWDHEVETKGRPTKDRLDCFFAAAGLPVSEAECQFIGITREQYGFGRGMIAAARVDTRRPVVMLQPHATCRARTWPLEKWKELADVLKAGGLEPVFVGLCKVAGTNVPQLVELQQEHLAYAASAADVMVTADSGMLHMAAAVRTPSVSVFGPTDGRLICKHYPDALVVQAEPVEREGGCTAPCHYQRAVGWDADVCRQAGCPGLVNLPVGPAIRAILAQVNRPDSRGRAGQL